MENPAQRPSPPRRIRRRRRSQIDIITHLSTAHSERRTCSQLDAAASPGQFLLEINQPRSVTPVLRPIAPGKKPARARRGHAVKWYQSATMCLNAEGIDVTIQSGDAHEESGKGGEAQKKASVMAETSHARCDQKVHASRYYCMIRMLKKRALQTNRRARRPCC